MSRLRRLGAIRQLARLRSSPSPRSRSFVPVEPSSPAPSRPDPVSSSSLFPGAPRCPALLPLPAPVPADARSDEGYYNWRNSTDNIYNGGSGEDFDANLELDTVDFGTFHLYPQLWAETPVSEWGLEYIQQHIDSQYVVFCVIMARP